MLLRSAAWHEGEETIDLWFDGVAAMNLHEGFAPLTIRAADADADERERLLTHAAGRIRDPLDRPPLCLILAYRAATPESLLPLGPVVDLPLTGIVVGA
ncbi:hypothetical protein FB465_7026 [Kitasatospora atroaurantiaca]|uniref:Uncharacterized protein n=1 Tax=Kitasatospora atroaurantiaca TaxID=285545 RepID=A0A561F1Q5_9ACTN|nr:hypothetical protein [Kitasatospora atroaurantiaca]TWE21800.1 hypothetical protein FB465_7026 [Kitasatospora atroaurantiaca]